MLDDAQLAGVVTGLGREHADHPDVAAERDGLDAVLGLTAPARPDGGAEADHVLGDLDAEPLGGQQVAELVQGDDDTDAEDDEQHTEQVHQDCHRLPWRTSTSDLPGTRVAGPGLGPQHRLNGQLPRIVSGLRRPTPRPPGPPCRRSPGRGCVPARNAVHALLVGGVEDRRVGRARLPHVPGEGHRGEGLVVQGQEVPRRGGGPVAGRTPRPAAGPASRGPGRSGAACRRRRRLGDGGPVVELDHRVDHLLRVHHDVDPLERDVEQQVGLDHLEPLVDQRRGVGRDDRAHREVGVGQGLGDGDLARGPPGSGRGRDHRWR